MLVWILLISIAILVLWWLWWNREIDPIYPTMHAQCRDDVPCGGDLVCDVQCKRCKQKLDGDCAENVDCETGFRCQDWKCVPEATAVETPTVVNHVPTPTKISWKATNEIFYI